MSSTATPLPAPDFVPTVPVSSLDSPLLRKADVTVDVVRLDQLDARLGGNKWFKLLPFLHQARSAGQRTLVSFGGAYSNHIAALAAAGQRYGFRTAGLIRGELVVPLNPVLAGAVAAGMTLFPVTRSDYRLRSQSGFAEQLCRELGLSDNVAIIPEGGAALAGVQGCQALANLVLPDGGSGPVEIALPCGTGTTAAGLIAGLDRRLRQSSSLTLTAGRSSTQNELAVQNELSVGNKLIATPPVEGLYGDSQHSVHVRGVAVLKGADFLQQDIARWLERQGVHDCRVSWCVDTEFHAGGYARSTPALREFIADFADCHGVPLEPVYSGKLCWAVMQRIEAGSYKPGTRIVLLHTGGIHPPLADYSACPDDSGIER